MHILEVLQCIRSDLATNVEISQMRSAEDDSPYDVWKIHSGQGDFVLKKAKGYELAVYKAFFNRQIPGVPRFLGSVSVGEDAYFLMEYIAGEDLRICTRQSLKVALDALIQVQAIYWENEALAGEGYGFEASLPGRNNRRNYLKDPLLEAFYDMFLEQYARMPRTLCHDDLLPFNILVADGKATIIDWEYGGILPYPVSLARLIAHCEDREGAFFYMTDADRMFAIDYYYENLIRQKGISYADYRYALDLCLLYEYCEWIMLGNRYPQADMERYRIYLEKAKNHIAKMKDSA